MSANRASSLIAKETGRGYHEVRVAINMLVNAGWSRFNAEQTILAAARTSDALAAVVNDLIERRHAPITQMPDAP